MEKLVTELEQITQQAMAELSMMDAERMSVYMEQRGQLMEAILANVDKASAAEKNVYKARLQAIISLDPIIRKKLEQFRQQASDQLVKLDQGKTQRNAYDQAYDQASLFFDRKK
ncbi:hypothetical protein [Paenibacillus whitsoniae]|uniref:Flagellar protein FliT n=1 Tax=Paenibacillus whitsoniae TaxID=2496558 RepID=A0A3S0C9F9_9BACL|nr:hypothetical protein [Paenibacillus whitsoniae]RTE07943.1 hypothetical protein EJQ19_20065 [Paenibacillus whitsoniae]